jgi:hypothetical protein
MKKLLDEDPDDFTRALLEAGARQRPPAGNRARLLVALGAGTTFGLLSAKAFAWCGTQAGKWTLFGVALCSAGAIYSVLPEPNVELAPPPLPAVIAPPPADEPLDTLFPRPMVDAPVPDAPELTQPSASVEVPAPTTPARTRRRSATPAATERPPSESLPVLSAERTDLDVEVRLVDQLRSATLRRDWHDARQLVDRYRQSFPEGQLEHEVSELAAQVAARSR